jgi:pimeloyl-ACP methyl ester carboxylesterase
MANLGLPQDGWYRAGAFFDWKGHRIFHRVEGKGSPVLLVHGFPTSSWDWARIWPALAAEHRVLALDLIGFGFSAKPRDFAYSVMAYSDLIESLLDREGVKRYHLVAHDLGVSVAQELLARKAPITSLCLLNGGLFPETHRALLGQKLLASPIGPIVARLMTFGTFARNMRQVCARPIADEELRGMWQLLQRDGGALILPKLIGYIEERKRQRERWVGALARTDVPVRLIDGLDDPVSGAHMVARYRALVPRPDVVELRGVGHYPQVEAPDEVLAAVRAQLAR